MTRAQRRNAVHMPVNMDPSQYEYVGAYANWDEIPGRFMPGPEGPQDYEMPDGSVQRGTNWLNAEYLWLRGLLAKSASTRSPDEVGWQCDHCGAHIRYVGVLRHAPTGDHIAVGEQCLDNRFSLQSKEAFQRLRKMSAEERSEQRRRKAVDGYLANCDSLVIDVMCGPATFKERNQPVYGELTDETPAKYVKGATVGQLREARENEFIRDVRRKLLAYGPPLSERQYAAVRRVADGIVHPVPKKDRPQEVWVAAPTGRVNVEGPVLAIKEVEGYMGDTSLKMLVACAGSGGRWKLWVTVPRAIWYGLERGDVVRLSATVEPSHDDPTFAFGSRPTRAKVIERSKDDEQTNG